MVNFSLPQILKLLFALTWALLLASCTKNVIQIEKNPEPEEQINNNTETTKRQIPRPKIDLTQDMLFKILMAEFAGKRNKIEIAVKNYLELAQTTRDPAIIERASHAAIYAHEYAAAQTAAELWLSVDPLSLDAQQILTLVALRNGDIDTAVQKVQNILNNSNGSLEQNLWKITYFLTNEKEDTSTILNLIERVIAANLSGNTDALYTYAQISARMGDVPRTEKILADILTIQPNNEVVATAYVSLLREQGQADKAISKLEQMLKQNTDNTHLRMLYARILTGNKRFNEAEKQFEMLIKKMPKDIDIIYTLGLLKLQLNKRDEGEKYFKKLSKTEKYIDDTNYYLAIIAEDKNQLGKAQKLYQRVQGGNNYNDAKIRFNGILAKQGKVDLALANIRALDKSKYENYLILTREEVHILTDAKRYHEAMQILDTSLAKKQHPDLLYARAMLAEQMGRLDILETDLKAILNEDADNATALNALGYTLADKTYRYDEAYSYISRAHELSPNNFYILDSMGWVLYRMGKHEEAVEFLRKALALRQDAEISAHLGEVLWVMGERREAEKIWNEALKITPKDEKLLETIKRFKP